MRCLRVAVPIDVIAFWDVPITAIADYAARKLIKGKREKACYLRKRLKALNKQRRKNNYAIQDTQAELDRCTYAYWYDVVINDPVELDAWIRDDDDYRGAKRVCKMSIRTGMLLDHTGTHQSLPDNTDAWELSQVDSKQPHAKFDELVHRTNKGVR